MKFARCVRSSLLPQPCPFRPDRPAQQQIFRRDTGATCLATQGSYEVFIYLRYRLQNGRRPTCESWPGIKLSGVDTETPETTVGSRSASLQFVWPKNSPRTSLPQIYQRHQPSTLQKYVRDQGGSTASTSPHYHLRLLSQTLVKKATNPTKSMKSTRKGIEDQSYVIRVLLRSLLLMPPQAHEFAKNVALRGPTAELLEDGSSATHFMDSNAPSQHNAEDEVKPPVNASPTHGPERRPTLLERAATLNMGFLPRLKRKGTAKEYWETSRRNGKPGLPWDLTRSIPLKDLLPMLSTVQRAFFEKLDIELDKVDTFYLEREKDMRTRYAHRHLYTSYIRSYY